jgi:hypothetical protein
MLQQMLSTTPCYLNTVHCAPYKEANILKRLTGVTLWWLMLWQRHSLITALFFFCVSHAEYLAVSVSPVRSLTGRRNTLGRPGCHTWLWATIGSPASYVFPLKYWIQTRVSVLDIIGFYMHVDNIGRFVKYCRWKPEERESSSLLGINPGTREVTGARSYNCATVTPYILW